MTDMNRPRRLTSVATEVEAASLITALNAEGIEAHAAGGHTAGFRAEAPGRVEIWVRSADYQRAQEALARIEAEPDSVDWSQIDVGRPID